MTVTISLNDDVAAKLLKRAGEEGKAVDDYASQLLEQVITKPTIDEILAPFRKQVAESGMTDEELDEFHRDLLVRVRADAKAKSA